MLMLLWLAGVMNVFEMPSVKVHSSENKARPEHCSLSNCSHKAVTELEIFGTLNSLFSRVSAVSVYTCIKIKFCLKHVYLLSFLV